LTNGGRRSAGGLLAAIGDGTCGHEHSRSRIVSDAGAWVEAVVPSNAYDARD